MAAKIIAFINFKGGVGKTSNAVNLGAALALDRHKRVLIVDLDPQCNATFWLLQHEKFDAFTAEARQKTDIEKTTFQVFQDALRGTKLFKIQDAIIRGLPVDDFGLELIPNLHLLPAAVDLFDTEFAVNGTALSRFLPSLRNALEPVQDDYDYIFLDCPPNLYYVAQAGALAAHHIIVPYNPDYLSLSGLKILCRQLHKLDEKLRLQRQKLHRNQVCGVTINRNEKVGDAYGTAISQLHSQVDLLKADGLVHPQCKVFHPIRKCVRLAESTSHHKPVLLHDPKSIGSEDYRTLADEFITHFDATP